MADGLHHRYPPGVEAPGAGVASAARWCSELVRYSRMNSGAADQSSPMARGGSNT